MSTFKVGDRVRHRSRHLQGTVVYAGCHLMAVKVDSGPLSLRPAVAFATDDLELLPAPTTEQRLALAEAKCAELERLLKHAEDYIRSYQRPF